MTFSRVYYSHLKIPYHRDKDLIHQSSPTSSGVYIYCRGTSATPVQLYPTVFPAYSFRYRTSNTCTHSTYNSRVYLPSPDNLIMWFDSQGRQPSPMTASLWEFGNNCHRQEKTKQHHNHASHAVPWYCPIFVTLNIWTVTLVKNCWNHRLKVRSH